MNTALADKVTNITIIIRVNRDMLHLLTLGHLDAEAVTNGRIVILKPLDMGLTMHLLAEIGEVDEVGSATLGGYPVTIKDGYVVCPWLMPHPIQQTNEFARRLHESTGCLIADVKRRQIISPSQFA
jgi:hypothetical protein